ncbi:MAG: Asp-tRNA(Asn)/Glu-tRNA(Gln) amidotransferase GatCAB subunit C, partial [Alphaproteobacteria bacterium HGW-Alphaproteobacteria-3]
MFRRDSTSKGCAAGAKVPRHRSPFPNTNKGGPMSVDQKTVRHIARLARIAVRDD